MRTLPTSFCIDKTKKGEDTLLPMELIKLQASRRNRILEKIMITNKDIIKDIESAIDDGIVWDWTMMFDDEEWTSEPDEDDANKPGYKDAVEYASTVREYNETCNIFAQEAIEALEKSDFEKAIKKLQLAVNEEAELGDSILWRPIATKLRDMIDFYADVVVTVDVGYELMQSGDRSEDSETDARIIKQCEQCFEEQAVKVAEELGIPEFAVVALSDGYNSMEDDEATRGMTDEQAEVASKLNQYCWDKVACFTWWKS